MNLLFFHWNSTGIKCIVILLQILFQPIITVLFICKYYFITALKYAALVKP